MMKNVLIFFFLISNFFAFSQNLKNYTVRVFDKNSDQQIDTFKIYRKGESLIIEYDNRVIPLKIFSRHLHLEYKYIDIFIDTVMNPNNCCVLLVKESPKGTESSYSECYYTNHHVVRNLNYIDKNPKNKYRSSDFFEFDEDFYLGAVSGLAYSGISIGGTFKYYNFLTGYENIIFNSEASVILSGEFKNGIDLGIGVRVGPLLPIGVALSSFIFNNDYSINIRPEVGWDFGLYSIIYGNNIETVF